MKKILSKISFVRLLVIMGLIVVSSTFNSCKDDFFEKHKPAWLGESLYDQIIQGYKEGTGDLTPGVNHTFNNFKRLIDDIGYAEWLKRTGSKTIFVADDAAFDRFYKSNPWGVTSYDGFSLAQKKLLMNSAMINNAYLIELMSSTEGSINNGPNQGQAMRRNTAFAVVDTVAYETNVNLPYGTNWNRHREAGYMLAKDNTPIPMVHFLQRHMDFKGITNEDFEFMFKGVTRVKNDAHIFGNKVIVKDITCKNGYMNILQDVLVPPSNMAEIIRTNPKTQVFSRILDRFSAPFYDSKLTSDYKRIHAGFIDSIFVKRYFSSIYSGGFLTPDKIVNPITKKVEAGYLAFDPGWNNYIQTGSTGMSMQTDMGAIFVPKDETLTEFFATGGGKFLSEKFGSIDNIPNDKLDDLLNNLMKPSFIGSVPHRFPEVLDDGQEPMGITKADVDSTCIANNGAVYITNKVYAPAAYAAVTAPALVNDNMKVFNWAVQNLGFDAYLLSMDSRYSYIVPSDITLPQNDKMGKGMYYIDPVSLGKPQPEMMKFWFDTKANTLKATVYKYDLVAGTVGDSIRLVTDVAILKDRLEDMLDYHIVVGDIEDGKDFYRTKGGGEIKVTGKGAGSNIQGSGNIESGIATPEPGVAPLVSRVYDQTKESNGRGNGKTYVVDLPLKPSTKSVYKILSEEPNFSEFFKLLLGNDQSTAAEQKKFGIFYKDASQIGLDFNIKFFNTYHYTVYVPTNAAVLEAISNGLPTWEVVKAQTNQVVKDSLTAKLVNFLRYHFQDNSVYIDGSSSEPRAYETAASYQTVQADNTIIKSYYKLYTKLTPTGLSVAANLADLTNGNAVNVTQNSGTAKNLNDKLIYPTLNNIMAREYKFNGLDLSKVSQIETSSYAVIHQIDKVLLYSKDELLKLKQLARQSATRSKSAYKKSSAK